MSVAKDITVEGVAPNSRSAVESWWQELERLARLMGRIGPDEVCCEGLTARQCSILRTLTRQEGARLTDLAAAAEISPSAMTRVVEKLEKQRLVQRLRGRQKDGRAAIVQITEAGRQVRARIDELMVERTQAILNAIPEDSREAVLSGLRLMNDCIERSGCCGLATPARDAERQIVRIEGS